MKIKNKILILVASILGIIVMSMCTVSLGVYLGEFDNGLDAVINKGAAAVNDTLTIRFRNLLAIEGRKDLYCVMRGEEVNKQDYTVSGYVSIDGNKAISGGKSVNSIENGKLAYILGQGQGYGDGIKKDEWVNLTYTTAQYALWTKLSRPWTKNVGNEFGIDISYSENDEISRITEDGLTIYKVYEIDEDDHKKVDAYKVAVAVEDLVDEATEYAENIGDGKDIQEAIDNTNKDNISVTGYLKNDVGYLRVGPFNWTFSGNITEINVYGDNDKSTSNIEFSKFVGSNEVFYESVAKITSGEDFYISLRADSGITNIKGINATTKLTNETIYQTQIWILKASDGDGQNLLLVDTSTRSIDDEIDTTFEYNIPLTKDLVIEKVDSRNKSIKLEGVGFKLKNKETGKYVREQNGQITYVDEKNATEFLTNEKGKIEIKGLVVGTYLAYETVNPNYGYKKVDGSIEIAVNKTTEVIPNEQIYVKLSGYVWKDIQSTKKTTRNDLYKTSSSDYLDDQDTAFNGIIVRLKDKNGNTIKETTTSERGLYSEINGGEYIFSDVKIDELSNYYVEFEYDGLIYQSVVLHLNTNTGSKATDKVERDILDKNFASVNSTGENKVNVNDKYSITYNDTVEGKTSIKDSSDCTLHANTQDAEYDISKQFSAGTEEIRYINLGLYERAQADLSLTQDLESVNVGVNGYWHIYNYGKRTLADGGYNADDSSTWNVGVKFKNSYTGTYKRAIYESDLMYETDDKNKELQVYLTYKIAITNESSYLTKANRIVDYFDNRYTLVGVGTELDEKKNITGNISYQTPEKYNDKYQKCIINVDTTVKSGESNYIYVQFKLDRSAVLEIMNNQETLYNRAEIDSYTIYKDNNESTTVAAVDRDSVPGNTKIENIATYEDDTDSAPPVKLELADARKITGTAFVDSTTGELLTGQIRQGNGILDKGETALQGVNVTLHEVNNSISDITTQTDENGNYEFTGYIPGQYTITYTWGDKTYTVQTYKGTVYDSSRDQNNMYWYKDDVDTRKTDAIDNYDTRIAIDNEIASVTDHTISNQVEDAYNGGDSNSKITITTMDSTTPTMEFGVEYETTVTDGTIDKVEFIVKNVDFGIVERARQQLDMTKRVSSFKIILANGQTLVDATVDEDGNLQGIHNYVTYMGPSVSNGYSNNGFIKAELDDELIEGATLEIGYEIKVINNSEADYMSEEYYKYGIGIIKEDVVTLTPSAVVDYLDKDLGFEQSKNSDWKQISVEELTALNAVKVEDVEFLNSRMILYTEKTATPLKPNDTVTVGLNVSKLLTTSNDLSFQNDAETVTINKPNDKTTQRGSIIREFPSDDAEDVLITPSTGEDRSYVLPISITIISLVALGAGVFVIKKFVK